MLGQRYTTSAIELSGENSDSWWLKVLVDQAIQGFAHFEFSRSLDKAKLDKLYVHPRAHRIGCARKLLDYAEHQLSKSGIEHITLQVNKGNVGSIKCYEHLGYSRWRISWSISVMDMWWTISSCQKSRTVVNMSFKFTKMEGAGNDFIVIDATTNPFSLRPSLIKRLSDRHFGIGFDQLLVVEKSQRKDVDFAYRIYNSDGGEVNQCGNGARCFAKFVYEKNSRTRQRSSLRHDRDWSNQN